MKWLTRRASVVLAIVLLAAACNSKDDAPIPGPNTTAEKSAGVEAEKSSFYKTPDDEFVFSIGADPESLDPGLAQGLTESLIITNLFEGLTEDPVGAGDPVPAIAKSWKISDDFLTYTFTLRQDATWVNSKGEVVGKITAEDFKYAWLRVLDPKFPGKYKAILWPIKGAAAYSNGGGGRDGVAITVLDDYTLQVTLEHPAPYFLELTSFFTYRPVHRATVEKYGTEWTRVENMVASGPYYMDRFQSRQFIHFVRNPHNWDAKNVALAGATIKIFAEPETMVNVFMTGELDWTGDVALPSLQMTALRQRDDYAVDPLYGTYYYAFNVSRKPYDNPKVLRALSAAINRDSIVTVIKGGIQPTFGFVPPSRGYVSQASEFDEDVDAAILLAEAGFPGGKGFPSITIMYNQGGQHGKVAEIVQQNLAQLGIKVELQQKEWKVYLADRRKKDYDVIRAAWIGDYTDPDTFLDLYTCKNQNNDTNWCDSEFDDFVAKSRSEPDRATRMKLLQQAEAILLTRGPLVPIYHYAHPRLLNPAVRGFKPHAKNQHPIKWMSRGPKKTFKGYPPGIK